MDISKRRMFSPDEDEILKKFVKENGTRNWEKASLILRGRTPRQCRDRYRNYLREGLNSHPWTDDEDIIIIKMVNEIGPKWVTISKMLIERNGIDVKNRWNELSMNLKIPFKSGHMPHSEKELINNFSSESFSNPVIVNNNSEDQDIKSKEDEKKEVGDQYSCQNNSTINNNSFDIAISEEEFYNTLSIMDCVLPIEEYNLLGSSKTQYLF